MSRKTTFLAALLVLCSGPALAQSVEITPTVGYVFGGEFDDAVNGDVAGSIDLDDSEEYGLSADFMTRDGWGVELLWMRQGTALGGSDDFFQTDADATINTFHIGGIYQFRRATNLQPFVVGTLGSSQIKSRGYTKNGFSYAAGGGVKFYFGEHFGARLQGSLSNSHFGAGDEAFCVEGTCYGLSDTNNVFRFHAQAGFIFKF